MHLERNFAVSLWTTTRVSAMSAVLPGSQSVLGWPLNFCSKLEWIFLRIFCSRSNLSEQWTVWSLMVDCTWLCMDIQSCEALTLIDPQMETSPNLYHQNRNLNSLHKEVWVLEYLFMSFICVRFIFYNYEISAVLVYCFYCFMQSVLSLLCCFPFLSG